MATDELPDEGDATRGIAPPDLPPRLTDHDLRELVLHTFENGRWTQDSPIVPEVWYEYIRKAEARLRARWEPAEEPVHVPARSAVSEDPERVSLILTPWSGVQAGDVAGLIRDGIVPDWSIGLERGNPTRFSDAPAFEYDPKLEALMKARIAASSNRVVADLTFWEMIDAVVPHTAWRRALWNSEPANGEAAEPANGEMTASGQFDLFELLASIRCFERAESKLEGLIPDLMASRDSASLRLLALAGIVQMFQELVTPKDYWAFWRYVVGGRRLLAHPAPSRRDMLEQWRDPEGAFDLVSLGLVFLKNLKSKIDEAELRRYEAADRAAFKGILYEKLNRTAGGDDAGTPRIWLVTLNRSVLQTTCVSRNTVKADAAARVFDNEGKGIVFAVVDTGVDAGHDAFADPDARNNSTTKPEPARSRIRATYDFSEIRRITAEAPFKRDFKFDTLNCAFKYRVRNVELLRERAEEIERELMADPSANAENGLRKAKELLASAEQDVNVLLGRLKRRALDARNLDWDLVAPLIRVPHEAKDIVSQDDKGVPAYVGEEPVYIPPKIEHGTHVAGILAADMPKTVGDEEAPVRGVCRQMDIWDLRVFDETGHSDEFSILCALEFLGWVNRKRNKPVVHGVNLSLALVHEVESFACGQTPICDACNRLVGAGTVVVAAAGNTGFEGSHKSLGSGYRSISVTDPGNASEVITVGSTHRQDPHAYGVSYFSARGPTGDGRSKPDILAPGEKIVSTIPNNRVKRMDGTSMAAPHVAGAAALLMARYPELIGDPYRIKEILMKTATDLRREPYFQGAGLVDILRAMQSV